MATIRKRGDKWQVQVRRKGCRPISKSFLRKADATAWAYQMETKADQRDLPVDHKTLDDLTLASIIERYLEEVVPKKRGQEIEELILKAFLRSNLAKLTLSAIKPQGFAEYRDKRLAKVKAATINRELGIIQHALDTARQEWGIPLKTNPVREIRKPKLPLARDRRLRPGEWDKLMEATEKCRTKIMKPLLILAVETAMRRGELGNIRWADMNLTDRLLHIPKTKNGHPRAIPLSPVACQVLADLQQKADDDGRVFQTTLEAVKLSWRRIVNRARIDDLHLH